MRLALQIRSVLALAANVEEVDVTTTTPRCANERKPMNGAPPFGPDQLVTLENWQAAPSNRWGFQHVRELVPSARIKRAGPVWNLPRAERDVLGVSFEINGARFNLADLLDETQTDAILVLHRGSIVAEHYFNGMDAETPHLLMSVSKSVTAALAGCLARRGAIEIDAPITDLVPELEASSFSGATTRHLLDMRAGIVFDEDYDNVDADVRVYEQIYQLRPRTTSALPRDALTYFATLKRDREHGGAFRYSSILTDVLAWVLERAGGERFHELVSQELWSPMGMEFDAEVTLDPHGNAMADGGISACLRDLGRLGLQYLPDAKNGRFQVVPSAWVRDTICGAADGPVAFNLLGEQPGFPSGSHYRSGWWIRNSDAPYLQALGIYGQNIFVYGPTNTVVVKLSSWATPLDPTALNATAAAVVAIGEYLEQ